MIGYKFSNKSRRQLSQLSSSNIIRMSTIQMRSKSIATIGIKQTELKFDSKKTSSDSELDGVNINE